MLILSFILACIALHLQGVFAVQISILAFGPLIAIATLKCEQMKALCWSLAAGMIMDAVSDDPMGVHALNYVFVAFVLFRIRKHFSYDEPLHLSVFTAFVSILSTITALFLLFLFDRRVPFDGRWIFADLIGMPVIDALYAFVWFAAPLLLAEKIRRNWNLFWLKRKNPSPTSP